MGKEKKRVPLLVPVGGGSFIKAKVATAETIVVGMGAGVSVEKPRGEAAKIVENRASKLEKSRETLQNQLNQVLERMNSGRQQLDEVSLRLAGRRQDASVRKTESRP